MRFVAGLFKSSEISDELDHQYIYRGDHNQTLRDDVKWRAGHMNTENSYWESVRSDISWQLSDGSSLSMNGPLKSNRPLERTVDQQALAQHPFFKNAQLVRDSFRTFYRSDGQLSSSRSTGFGEPY